MTRHRNIITIMPPVVYVYSIFIALVIVFYCSAVNSHWSV